MKLTGTYNGKPIELELTEEQVEVLKEAEKKKTGWERAKECESYWTCDGDTVFDNEEENLSCDDEGFNCANYFSNKTLSQNIARAQTLQRKLWRRSAELCEKVDWENPHTKKYCIAYDYDRGELYSTIAWVTRGIGEIYFDSEEHAEQAIEEFRDELIWYFTKFESRMD